MSEQNPRYERPFSDKVFPRARHHVVPFQKLVTIGKEILAHPNEAEKNKYVDEIIDAYFSEHPNVKINFGSKEDLKEAIKNKRSEMHDIAERDFLALLAWLPGNLVIGPNNRADDPGNNLDHRALSLSALKGRRGSFYALNNHVTNRVEYYIVAFIIDLAKGAITKTTDGAWE